MTPKFASLSAAVLGLALATNAFAQDPKDVPQEETKSTSEIVGEKVKNAVQSIERGAKDAGDAVRGQYNKMRTSIHDMGVAGRIYGRIHWDKALADAKIDVDVTKNGVATLTGTVADAKLKAKAADLTRDTVGVTSVVDKVVISPTTTINDAPAPVSVDPK
ncbi:BON domain-containing protein [Singulisphaera sp. PoT]|uniref:BON domain-containing protein n=1 Tax=Singulisphaera sp. PoT TaxID=3411797 RepID=UPI003BF5CDF1